MNIWDKTCKQAKSKLAQASSKDKKFMIVAECFAQSIKSGTIPENTALPAQRKLAKDLNLTLATINRVYQQLSSIKAIISYPGKGSVTLNTQVKIDPKLEQTNNTLPEIIDSRFTVSFHLQDTRQIESDIPSEPSLDGFLDSIHINTQSRQAHINPSFFDALETTLIQILQPSDTLLCFDLTYPALASLANKLNFNIKTLNLRANTVDIAVLEQYCSIYHPAALFIHSMTHNPTGGVLNQLDRELICKICDKYEVKIIEDTSLNWMHPQAHSFTKLSPTNTFSLNSLTSLPLIESKHCILQIPESFNFEFELALSINDHSCEPSLIHSLQGISHNLNSILHQGFLQSKKLISLTDPSQSHSSKITIGAGLIWISCSSTDQSNQLKMLLGDKKILSLTEESFNTQSPDFFMKPVSSSNNCGVRLCYGHLNDISLERLCIAIIQCVAQLESAPPQKHTQKTQPNYSNVS